MLTMKMAMAGWVGRSRDRSVVVVRSVHAEHMLNLKFLNSAESARKCQYMLESIGICLNQFEYSSACRGKQLGICRLTLKNVVFDQKYYQDRGLDMQVI